MSAEILSCLAIGFVFGAAFWCLLTEVWIPAYHRKQLMNEIDSNKRHYCHECRMPIISTDDEAMICIDCGGKNRTTARGVNDD